jgi:pyrroline-5-carboxylate reductase
VASIVAATRLEQLEAAYPGVPVYRLMPNIPVEVGRVMELDEPLLEPAMALMSCGPAFMALVVQGLADAGERHGLDTQTAARLVVETMAGTAAYLDANDLDAAELRHRVATPGGVTERGLAVLEDRGLPAALGAAVDLVVESTR